jgi:hypothetical protein
MSVNERIPGRTEWQARPNRRESSTERSNVANSSDRAPKHRPGARSLEAVENTAARYAMSILRGPMTRSEIRAARGVKDPAAPIAEAAAPIARESEVSPVGDTWTSKGTRRALSAVN